MQLSVNGKPVCDVESVEINAGLAKAVAQTAEEIRAWATDGFDAKESEQPVDDPAFNLGDVVCVRSGSPWMTVTDIRDTGTTGKFVTCFWMPNDKAVRQQEFPAIALRKKRPEDDRYKDWLDQSSILRGRSQAVEASS